MMSSEANSIPLPPYQVFFDNIVYLNLPFSPSELHGAICGYLCAKAKAAAEHYLHSLVPLAQNESIRAAATAIFELYSISEHQLSEFNFEFNLLLPEEHENLSARAEAFSEWCTGFVQSISIAGIDTSQLEEEEAQEALTHLRQFANLDFNAIKVSEANEKALMEISEYTRMAVIRLYDDLLSEDDTDSLKEVH